MRAKRRLLAVAVLAVFGCVLSANAQTWVPGVGAVCKPAQLGRLGLLRNVHAYDQDGTAVAPIRCIAELLGAQVDYKAPSVVIRATQPPVTIEIEPGSRLARVNGREVDMGAEATSYGGIACAPLRFLVESLGGEIEYVRQSHFDFAPAIHIQAHRVLQVTARALEAISEGNDEVSGGYMLLHLQPPDAVAKAVADMEWSHQYDELDPEISYDLEQYGINWVLRLGALASDGLHFRAGCPAMWEADMAYTEEVGDSAFVAYAYGVYRLHAGQWRLLVTGQDELSYGMCDRIGLSYSIARELDIGPAHYEDPPVSPSVAPPAQLDVTYYLSLENARTPVQVGGGYYVMGLNFTKAFDFTERGTKVLGQVLAPAFEATDKPVRIEMTLTAFDKELRVIGSSSLNFHLVSSHGATLPFEATLLSVRLEDLAFVGIAPKGAWVPRD